MYVLFIDRNDYHRIDYRVAAATAAAATEGANTHVYRYRYT